MRVTTLIKKLFGESSLSNMMDAKDEDDTAIEFWSIDTEEDAAEPSYFLRLYQDGMYKLSDINGKNLLITYVVSGLKNKLKVLAANAE
jgi:hypothetical protein